MPPVIEFLPSGNSFERVVLTVDEYESIRLIDKQGISQEECAAYMQVARTTVQAIYNSARRKLADALVNGKGIKISGGDYHLCDGKASCCDCAACLKCCKER